MCVMSKSHNGQTVWSLKKEHQKIDTMFSKYTEYIIFEYLTYDENFKFIHCVNERRTFNPVEIFKI